MRLNEDQVKGIIDALSAFLKEDHGQLRLYGSRLRDDLKGGDIDLLLIMENKIHASALLEKKHFLLAAIKKIIGDQKIDLVITDKQQLDQDAFLKMILPSSIVLYQQ